MRKTECEQLDILLKISFCPLYVCHSSYVTFFGEEFCYEDSPYVVQGQSVFDLDVDLSLEKIFCHLARIELMFEGLLNSERLFGVEYDTKNIPDACFDGKSRGDIGLELISQMWDAYSARPKFGKIT